MSNLEMARTVDYKERGIVKVLPDSDALAWKASMMALELLEHARKQNGASYVALSGGSTPKRMGQILAQPEFKELEVWETMQVFWGDERWVPLDDKQNNAGEAKKIFLDHVVIPVDRVHPIPTDAADPDAAATAYAELISRVVPAGSSRPCFDLVFLGMGDDGHTASLFPYTDGLAEKQKLVISNYVPKLKSTRITMTEPLLNAARNVIFLIGGSSKASTLAAVLEGPADTERLPSQLIRPTSGSLTWLIDEAAAAELKRK